IIAPVGRNGLDDILAVLSDLEDERVPVLAPHAIGPAK
ncbi:MAG: hypothetical protein JWP84_1064, partial [Tardiphaga sp.]|nr:hypothetical protein [Tardiphaga sp.]